MAREDLKDAFLALGFADEGDERLPDDLKIADFDILPVEHGGIRLVFPSLYGWKSAKFLHGSCGLIFSLLILI